MVALCKRYWMIGLIFLPNSTIDTEDNGNHTDDNPK
jgi:hypothetical protein